MITTKEESFVRDVANGFICDKCKQSFENGIDFIEWQERLSVSMLGGFGCVYGDGNELEFDLCQSCLYDMVKGFARINGRPIK